MDEQLVLLDLGAPRYTADIFGPRRYTYLSTSSRGHNCPLVNNTEQRPGRSAAGKTLTLDLAGQHLLLDLTTAYPPDARLARWTRGLRRTDAGYELVDEFVTRAAVPIENVFWSHVPPHVEPGLITCGPLLIHVDPDARTEISTIDPIAHHLRDFKDTRLHRIGIHYQTTADTPLRVVMSMTATPGS